MPYNRISTPKFFIDAALLARQWGMVDLSLGISHFDTTFNLNPSNVTDVTNATSREEKRTVKFWNRNFANSISHCFILGHRLKEDDIQVRVEIASGTNNDTLRNYAEEPYNGWSKYIWAADSTYDYKRINVIFRKGGDNDESTAIDTKLGDISIGWSWEAPHSPDLELTLNYSNESITAQTTKGGHTLTNAGYNRQPIWDRRQPWSRGETENSSNLFDNFRIYPSGRRSWNLKFSYLSEENLFSNDPSYSEYGIFNDYGTWTIKDDFSSKLLFGTNNFQLPFIFQPNKSEDEYAICRIDNDTTSFEQVANNVYNISLNIVEVW